MNVVTNPKEIYLIMAKTFKIITVVVFILGAVVCILFVLYYVHKKQANLSPNVDTSIQLDKGDTYSDLQTSNPSFEQGVQAIISGDSKQAVALFEKSKEKATSDSEKAVIDFNIASAKFNLDRASGVDDFIAVSKNELYPKRTRALAMIRAYLMYAKYNDQAVLLKLANGYGIQWTGTSDVINSYMKRVYKLYPFAYPAIIIVEHNIASLKDKNKDQVLAKYTPFAQVITNDITIMKGNSGESTELTSTMLANARLLGILNIRFGAISKTEVEKAYEDLINYDQTKNLKVNMQFALLSYSVFESAAKDYAKADQVIGILASSPLESSVKEFLSKTSTSTYPYLFGLSSKTSSQSVRDLVATIGTAIKK
jgi:hypothetical protein